MKTLLKIGLGMIVLAVVLVGTTFGALRAQDAGAEGSHAMKNETRKLGGDVTVIDFKPREPDAFTRETYCMAFYDSIVVFEKGHVWRKEALAVGGKKGLF